MDKKQKRMRDILFKIYAALYKASTPSADFYELLENAPWCTYENGQYVDHPEGKFMPKDECVKSGWQKKIDYENYRLDSEEYDAIVTKILNRHKLDDTDRQALRVQAYLGCGPTAVLKEEKETQTI